MDIPENPEQDLTNLPSPSRVQEFRKKYYVIYARVLNKEILQKLKNFTKKQKRS